ncbi:ABC transporter ATP-binding protein [Aquisalimonas lutea]|uniref:ABC transporter ATP-binding protein n=1 Tax=Aquisalimonas lutea TaxID=1327750 RepID=UPI0025B36E0B|nr:ABC transporter ATP-binding protein [Aquisalimonas lutea]MDN3516664.1 ABC transporter ATP-binding protein [Aquisalimonas lutea]
MTSVTGQPPFPDAPIAFTAWAVRAFVRRRAALMVLMALLAFTLQAFTPFVIGRLVDAVGAVARDRAQPPELAWLFAALVLCWLAGPLFQRLYVLVNAYTVPRLRADVINRLFAWTTGHAPQFFHDRFAGALSQRVRQAADGAGALFNEVALAGPRTFVTLLVSGGLVATTLPQFAVAYAVFAVVFVAVAVVMARYGVEFSRRMAAARSRVSGRMADSFGNVEVVRDFAGEAHEQALLGEDVAEEYRRGRNARLYFTAMRVVLLLLTVGFMSGLTWVALGHAAAGALSAGDIAMLLTIGVNLAMVITQLGDDVLECFEFVGVLRESLDSLAIPHAIVDCPGAPPLAVRQGAIELEAVRYCYPDGQRVFDGLDLAIAAGERVGLVGPSGAGKSTLLKLLARHHALHDGVIRIDGQDIAAVQWQSLHRRIAKVSQATELFHRSIRDNIRYARPDATKDEVKAAARAAHCHEFILARPGGYDAVVGERGVKLSGGERQRIAIARALLKDAPILLLDEATASLDSESEAVIQAALWRLMQGRTVIAIAHRLSTVTVMDRILYLEAGRLVEQGTHNELLAKDGKYAAMSRCQA